MLADKSEQKREQTMMEHQVGRDLKEYLVHPFLSKARSRQDSQAPCPAEP